jgi:hypothetical protein
MSNIHYRFTSDELESAARTRRKDDKRNRKRQKAVRRAEAERSARRALAFDTLETVAADEAEPDDASARIAAANSLLEQS